MTPTERRSKAKERKAAFGNKPWTNEQKIEANFWAMDELYGVLINARLVMAYTEQDCGALMEFGEAWPAFLQHNERDTQEREFYRAMDAAAVLYKSEDLLVIPEPNETARQPQKG